MSIDFNPGMNPEEVKKVQQQEDVKAKTSTLQDANPLNSRKIEVRDLSANVLDKLANAGALNLLLADKVKALEENEDVQTLMQLMGATFDISKRAKNFKVDEDGTVTYISGNTTYVYNPEKGTLTKSITQVSNKYKDGIVTEYNEWSVDTSKNPPEKELTFRINNQNGEAAGLTVKNGTLVYLPKHKGIDTLKIAIPRTSDTRSMYTHPDGSVEVVSDSEENYPENGVASVSDDKKTVIYTQKSLAEAYKTSLQESYDANVKQLAELLGIEYNETTADKFCPSLRPGAERITDEFGLPVLNSVSYVSNGVQYDYNADINTLVKTITGKDGNIAEEDTWSIDPETKERTLTRRIVNNSRNLSAAGIAIGHDKHGKTVISITNNLENKNYLEELINNARSVYIDANNVLTIVDADGNTLTGTIEELLTQIKPE